MIIQLSMLTKIKSNSIYIILVLAFILRSFAITSTPSLNPDEAAIGYDSYSLLETGKDEHGISWPLHFKSFGDFKPGGYFYLVLPFVKILGLNELAVRLPNLILSILTILFLYKLVFQISKNKNIAVLSALVLSISPWHIHFSRGGWEASAALSFIVMGSYFFFKSLEKKITLNFFLFIFFYVCSLYIYHSARLIAPLLALSFILLNFKYLLKNINKIIIPVIIGIIIAMPVLFSFLKNGGTARFGGVGITADQGPIWRANELINHHNNVKLINRAMHNQRILYLLSWGQKYTSHFDLNFLFINGDEVPRSKVPDMGQLYLVDIIFLTSGLFFLFSKQINSNLKSVVIIWLLISPVASSLTFQAPSALRSLPMVIPLSIIIAIGIYETFSIIPQKLKMVSVLIIGIIYLYSLSYYLDSYYVHYPKRLASAWSYGFPELVKYTEAEKYKYDNVYVTDKYDQPYIIFLFYSKYNPSLIQKEITLTKPDQYGFSTVRHYNKYTFTKIDWNTIPSNSLVITSDEPAPVSPIKTIYYPNNKPVFNIYIKQ